MAFKEILEELDCRWNNERYFLEAREDGGTWKEIDRSEAADKDGVPHYSEYFFGRKGTKPERRFGLFYAAEVEEYLKNKIKADK